MRTIKFTPGFTTFFALILMTLFYWDFTFGELLTTHVMFIIIVSFLTAFILIFILRHLKYDMDYNLFSVLIILFTINLFFIEGEVELKTISLLSIIASTLLTSLIIIIIGVFLKLKQNKR